MKKNFVKVRGRVFQVWEGATVMKVTYDANYYKDEKQRHASIMNNGWLHPMDSETERLSKEAEQLKDDDARLKQINDRLVEIINYYYEAWKSCN